MRLDLLKPIRRDWKNFPGALGLLLEKDLPVGSSRLRAKLLVFDKPQNLRHFWKKCLEKGELGKMCRGAVNGLYTEVVTFPSQKKHMEADPRYFCVIGLVQRFLGMEVICHESVHAGYCYVKRIRRSPWDQLAKDFDEEEIAYPTGEIARQINIALHAAKFYD